MQFGRPYLRVFRVLVILSLLANGSFVGAMPPCEMDNIEIDAIETITTESGDIHAGHFMQDMQIDAVMMTMDGEQASDCCNQHCLCELSCGHLAFLFGESSLQQTPIDKSLATRIAPSILNPIQRTIFHPPIIS